MKTKTSGLARRCATLLLAGAASCSALGQTAYQVKTGHPRLLVEDVRELARRCEGPLADDYWVVKQRADAAVRRGGIEFIANGWSIPEDLMNCGLAFLVERERGREHRAYAEVIVKPWGDGRLIENRQGSHFGYPALAYDWIFDALTAEQRVRYGDALGSWLRFFTDRPEILLKWGHWEYNQTWGPIHLNIMNCRDALTQKLFIALAIAGAGTRHEADARSFLDSWHKRVPLECLPAFDRMGGIWSESYGHGAYGPVTVIPYAFRAWQTATGLDYFKQLKPWGYPLEPKAQYNHTTERRQKPPLCPWRIEVGDPGPGARTLFLHVFEIGDETLRRPTALKFVAPAGLDIGDRWHVRFHAAGPLGGHVGDQGLATTVQTDAQYLPGRSNRE